MTTNKQRRKEMTYQDKLLKATGSILAILFILSLVGPVNAQTYQANGKEISKVEALRMLITNPKAEVTKCQLQELSDKATIRNKKQKAKK